MIARNGKSKTVPGVKQDKAEGDQQRDECHQRPPFLAVDGDDDFRTMTTRSMEATDTVQQERDCCN